MRRVLEAFDRWRAQRAPLVLVTVVDTEGSTYTKAGHRILMTGTGEFQGLVSGGCLEGDLAEHARELLASGRPQVLTYDLRDGSDELWGLGIGCNGLFRVLLQPLTADERYEPFTMMASQMLGERIGVTATVVESDAPEPPIGATAMSGDGTPAAWRLEGEWRRRLISGCLRQKTAPHGRIVTETLEGRTAKILYASLRPLPRLLVLGAGLDAVALVDLAHGLGWRVTVADHRPAYVGRGDLTAAERALRLLPGELSARLPLAQFSAAVVMSHHLVTDRAWLKALANSSLGYIGLLGPAARRDRLLADLGAAGDSLRPRLHAPAGLPIGADSPEAIALAILAEVQATLTGHLDGKSGSH